MRRIFGLLFLIIFTSCGGDSLPECLCASSAEFTLVFADFSGDEGVSLSCVLENGEISAEIFEGVGVDLALNPVSVKLISGENEIPVSLEAADKFYRVFAAIFPESYEIIRKSDEEVLISSEFGELILLDGVPISVKTSDREVIIKDFEW